MQNRCQSLALRALVALSVLAGASAAYADCGGTLDQASCGNVHSTLLYIDANLDAWVATDANTSTLPCATSNGLLRLPSSSSNFKAVYATLLAVHLSSRLMNIRLAPNASQCTITYVSVP